jgi:hypothetical protein
MGKDKESYEKNLEKFKEISRDLDEERRSKKKKKKKDRKRSPSPEKVSQKYSYMTRSKGQLRTVFFTSKRVSLLKMNQLSIKDKTWAFISY